jgi:hypothetical protein
MASTGSFATHEKGYEALPQDPNNKQFAKFMRNYTQSNDTAIKQIKSSLNLIMGLLTTRNGQTAGAPQPVAAGTAELSAANPPIDQQATAVTAAPISSLQPVHNGPSYSNETRHPDGSINLDICPAGHKATAVR